MLSYFLGSELIAPWMDMLAAALTMIGVVMTMAAYTVLAERKVCGYIQGRYGPNRTNVPIIGGLPIIGNILTRMGVFQPLADAGKFLFKEEPIPGHVNKFYYVLAPCISMIPALTTMTVLPVGQIVGADGIVTPLVLANLDIGMLFILAVSSLGVYGIILAGWSANSKYPFLGGIRASAQMISYELAMGLSLLPVFMWAGHLNLTNIVLSQQPLWLIFWQPVSALIFLVALIAECNRLPFDMPEAETELVAGFNTEYGAFKFGLFFTAEYAHIVVGSAIFTALFLGGWTIPFISLPAGLIGAALSCGVFFLKTCAIIFLIIQIRWTIPRFRYDQIMNLGWKVMLPIAIGNLVVYAIGLMLAHKLGIIQL